MSLHDNSAASASLENVLDPEVLARYRPELFAKIAQIYLDTAPGQVQVARSALDQGDVKAIHQTCHTLKSSGANVGAMEFSALCRQLEAAALDKDLETVSALLPKFMEAHDATIEALKNHLA